jgi:hypothetical protein
MNTRLQREFTVSPGTPRHQGTLRDAFSAAPSLWTACACRSLDLTGLRCSKAAKFEIYTDSRSEYRWG